MSEKKKAFLEKVSAFRVAVAALDWSDDGEYINTYQPNRNYKYITAKKAKRNFRQPMAECGIEMKLVYSELTRLEAIGSMSQHFTVKLTMILLDIEDGNLCISYEAYGEAGDSGDKAVNKAQSDALKQIIFNEFMVGDSSDPDAQDASDVISAAGKKPPATPEQREIIKTKIEDAKVENVPVSAPTSAPAPSAPAVAKQHITEIQKKAMARLVSIKRRAAEDGLLTSTDVDVIEAEMDNVLQADNPKDAAMFIQKYKE